MTVRTLIGLCMALGSLAAAPVAQACSMRAEYRTPTNFELLEKAELVVLGRLQGAPSRPSGDLEIGPIALQPLRVLKGTLPDEPLTITGASQWNGVTIPSLPTSLAQSHFSAGMGACVRIFYPSEGLVLAMFERGPEGLVQSWAAFARTAEDVEAEDGIWVRAAEAYLALQARSPPQQRRQAVEAWLAELTSPSPPDPLNQAMAADLRHHLAATAGAEHNLRSPFWSLLNMPGEVAAGLSDGRTEAQRGSNPGSAALACRAGSGVLLVISRRTDRVHDLRLAVGSQTFEVTGERIESSFGEKYLEGDLPLTEQLLTALASPAAAAGVAIGDTSIAAPPAEVLPLLARQCRLLRTQPPMPDEADPASVSD